MFAKSVAIAVALCQVLRVAAAGATATPVNELDSTSVQDGLWLVKFCTPSAPLCQKIESDWNQLASFADNAHWDIRLGQVNCHVQQQLCDDYEVMEYPDLLVIKDGTHAPNYSGRRAYVVLKSYAQEAMAQPATADRTLPSVPSDLTAGKLLPMTPAATLKKLRRKFNHLLREYAPLNVSADDQVHDLAVTNFTAVTANGPWLLNFYAPWCKYSQQLAPIYEALAVELKGQVNVARIDAAADADLSTRFDINGYPTILFYRDGKSTPFSGERTLDALTSFALYSAGQPIRDVSWTDFQAAESDYYFNIVLWYDQDTTEHQVRAYADALKALEMPCGKFISSDPAFALSTGDRRGAVRVFFPDHPAGSEVLEVKDLTTQTLAELMARYSVPQPTDIVWAVPVNHPPSRAQAPAVILPLLIAIAVLVGVAFGSLRNAFKAEYAPVADAEETSP
ncbi:hypothetical protein RI367_004662 [Sorochytrium milnesiophthora]